ncbi:hypothetical protein [Halomontanus rarus]|uniref:hypothetical protein n=1 Tax=Halomontanus rarus TaxID=3034020 RepID=UPI001A97DFAF
MISDTGTSLLYLTFGIAFLLIGAISLQGLALPILSMMVGFWLLANWRKKW